MGISNCLVTHIIQKTEPSIQSDLCSNEELVEDPYGFVSEWVVFLYILGPQVLRVTTIKVS